MIFDATSTVKLTNLNLKTMKKLLTAVMVLLLFVSCNDGIQDKILATSTGRFNELLIIIPQKDWQGDIGQSIKDSITTEVIGLPQIEPQFSVIQIEPRSFNGLLLRTRNILEIKKGQPSGIQFKTNEFSKPQVYITVSGKNDEEIAKVIYANAEKIIAAYKKSDLQSLMSNPNHPFYPASEIPFLIKNNISLNIPNNFKPVDVTDNFLWYRYETYDPGKDINGSMNVIVYFYPLKNKFSTLKDSLVTMRDQLGALKIPGPKEGTHYATEAAYAPHIFETTLHGKPAFKTYGKWEIRNGFMAGPFISYAVEDVKHQRIIVAEGFVYAPMVNKRDYMFELEAVVSSLKINNTTP